jgi:hypothetical protein
MAVITSGKTFANGEQLTADKLNQVITAATFNSTDAVDNSTIILVGGAMAVRDTGITTAKIADSNVTKAKIENVANMKVLGNTSGGATAPQEVAILDEDDMSTDSNTSLATQQSIKAYVDSFPSIKAHCVFDGTQSGTFQPYSGSYGITSITRTATGTYTVTMSVTAPSATFTCLASGSSSGGSTNRATGAESTSTTTAQVTRSIGSTGAGTSDGNISFIAIF